MDESYSSMRQGISRVLRIGAAISAALILMGTFLVTTTGDTSCPENLLDWGWIIWGDPFLAPSHLIFLGFLALVSTPIATTAFSVVSFIRMGDKLFAWISSLVLLILLLSQILGIG